MTRDSQKQVPEFSIANEIPILFYLLAALPEQLCPARMENAYH